MADNFDRNDLFFIQSKLSGTRKRLFDLATWKNGLAFKNIDFSPMGKPVIKIAELNNGITESTAYTGKKYDSSVSLTRGDIVFSWSGNPQTSIDAFIYKLPDGWLNQHIFKVTPASNVDAKFLFYILKYLKPNFTKIATNKQTTGLGHVTLEDIKHISVLLPNIILQQQISAVLSALDSKIEQNTAINNNLEQQAQALFKSWFIDFEPFGGTMPEDWSERYLSEFVELTQGKYIKDVSVNKTEKYKYPVYGGGGIRGFVAEYTHADPVVIVGCRGTCGIVDRTFQSASITNSVISFDIKSLLGINFLYLFLKNRGLTEFISGSAVPQITKTALSNISLLVPSENILRRFEEITGSFYSYITSNKFENERLAEIRDALLPKLMSGEIDVSKVDISDPSCLDKSLFNKETE